uniref:Peptidase S1 domain-containing protein n=1 Tax=Heliothis virescens TaxID=7102 RepID=A0A2A4JC95_HELVI
MNNFGILCVIALYGASYSAVEGASRIMGGSNAIHNQFRYMVSLQRLSEVNEFTRGHRCGGALITLNHVLTAASCLYDNNAGIFTLIAPAQYRLFAGAARLDDDSSSERFRSISDFTVHPQFVPTQPFNNDIAVITAASPFSSIAAAALQLPTTDITVTNLGICRSPGWGGQNASASASNQLMFTENRITVNSHCTVSYYEQGTTISMLSSMICAQPITNSSGCQGDLGNPLVCNNQLHGVLFLSKDCSSPMPVPLPDVYTRVFSYRAWLNEIIGDDEPSGAATYQSGIGLLTIFALVQIVATIS